MWLKAAARLMDMTLTASFQSAFLGLCSNAFSLANIKDWPPQLGFFFFNSFPYKVPKIKEDSLGSTVMSRFMQTFISTSGVSLARTMARSIFFFLICINKSIFTNRYFKNVQCYGTTLRFTLMFKSSFDWNSISEEVISELLIATLQIN